MLTLIDKNTEDNDVPFHLDFRGGQGDCIRLSVGQLPKIGR